VGQGKGENPQGGAKKRVNPRIKKFDKSVKIVVDNFIMHYVVLIKEKSTFSQFQKVFLKRK
jgi:uncharacterized FlaG/YvyC family protein